MKTFVVLAGLMVIVPRVDSRGEWRGLTVLVLDAESAPQYPGEPVHHHVAKVTNLGGTLHETLEGTWTLESQAANRPIEVAGSDRYLVLERMYGTDSKLPRMRQECYDDYHHDVVNSCRDANNKRLVRAVLTFTNGWRVRPVEITHDREPRAMVYDDSTWGFMPLPGNKLVPQPPLGEIQLSAGLILEPLDDQAPTIKKAGTPISPLEPLPRRQICALFAGYAGNCAVLRFLNVMHTMPFHGNQPAQIDFTQLMMYDLFRDEKGKRPSVRYVTMLRKDARAEVMDLLYPGGGGSPFPRPCPPPAFAPFVELQP